MSENPKFKLIKNNIVNSHYVVQKESVLQLYSLLNTEKSLFDSGVTQLLQLIYDESPFVVEVTIQCILELVKNKKLHRETVLNQFLDSLGSLNEKNIGFLLQAIVDLSLDLEYMSKTVSNKDQLQRSPLMTVARQYCLSGNTRSTTVFELLIAQISDRILSVGESTMIPASVLDQRYELLQPVIGYLLVTGHLEKPLESSMLLNSLIRIAFRIGSLYSSIVSNLCTLIYLFPRSNATQLNQIVVYQRQLIDLLERPPVSSTQTMLMTRIQNIQTLSYLCLDLYQSPDSSTSIKTTVLQYLQTLVKLNTLPLSLWVKSKSSSSNQYNTPIIVILLLYLSTSMNSNQQIIISLLEMAIDQISKKSTNLDQYEMISLKLFISPLIRKISSSPSSISSNKDDKLNSLLKSIEVLLHKQYNLNSGSSQPESKEEIFKLNNIVLGHLIPIQLTFNNYLTLFSGQSLDTKKLREWLEMIKLNLKTTSTVEISDTQKENSVIDRQQSYSFQNELLMYFLSVFLQSYNDDNENELVNQVNTVQILPKIIESNSLDSISLIPVFFYCIQHETDAEVVLELLENLTFLGSDKICFGLIVKMIQSLCGTSGSKVMSSSVLRLYCQLWKVNNKIFSKIQEILYQISMESDLQDRISAAACILDICNIDPYQGQELIQPLSTILCKDNHPTTLSLGLDALSSLCKAEILSFTSAWSVIKKNLGQEEGFDSDKRSPLVLSHLLDFFSNGIQDCKGQVSLDDKKMDIYSDLFQRLWNLSNHQSNEISSKAFKLLSSFLDILENQDLIQLISNPERTGHILTLYNTNVTVDSGVEELLTKILNLELKEKRQLKSIHLGKNLTKSIQLSTQLLGKIHSSLYNDLVNETRVGIKSGVLGGLIYSTNTNPEISTKKETLMNYKMFSNLLQEATQNLDTTREYQTKLMSLGGWSKFMLQCFQAYKKNLAMRLSLPSATEKLTQKEQNERVFSEIEKVLLDMVESNQSSIQSENAILALVMMARNQYKECYVQLESTVQMLLKWVQDDEESEMVKNSSYLGLSLLCPCLLQDSPLLSDSLNILIALVKSPQQMVYKSTGLLGLSMCLSQLSLGTNIPPIQQLINESNQLLIDQFFTISMENQDDSTLSQVSSNLVLAMGYACTSFERNSLHSPMTKLVTQFQDLFEKGCSDDQNQVLYGYLLVTYPILLTSCFKLNLIDKGHIQQVLQSYSEKLQSLSTHKYLSMYLTIGYCTLVSRLLSISYSLDTEVVENLFTKLSSSLEGTNSRDIVNSIMGLSILLGSPILSQDHQLLNGSLKSSVLEFLNSKTNKRKDYQIMINNIVGQMITCYESTNQDSRVLRYAAWSLGSITLPNSSNGSDGVAIKSTQETPDNLDHLPSESLVKILFNQLQSSQVSPVKIESLLRIFSLVDGQKLPIVNWGSLLKRLFTTSQQNEIRQQCILFSANNISLSTNIINFTDWISPSQFKSYAVETQQQLLSSLPKILDQLPMNRVPAIFDDLLLPLANQSLQSQKFLWNLIKNMLETLKNITVELKSLFVKFIIKSIPMLPSLFKSDATSKDTYLLDEDTIQLLNGPVSGSLEYLPNDIAQILPLTHSISNIQQEAKINYLYVQVLQKGVLGNYTLQYLFKIKSWCFSVTSIDQYAQIQKLLPLLLIQPILSKQLNVKQVIIDILDSLLLSNSPSIGFEYLSQYLIYLNQSKELQYFFNYQSKRSLEFPLSNGTDFLPYYWSRLFTSSHIGLNAQETNSKLVKILQNKLTLLSVDLKQSIFRSLLNVYHLKPSDLSSNNLYTLYKLIN
ncbi:armadillo-like helical domain-containing protein [Tieghemostelium lacteum]|uniref:Armadillo-like helical domain-containing protein n=1 Tax=Tieghemostelium lacteum TaxID=361077 RepID=A0A152A971_TIELA|nr:armadillo-like helical domain-containing protein [Tieghemostelium lacteum]|eukprot:KYR02766.1 armadillo-like helical domain-containing protein [Tieghemostelium lacteum]